MNSILIITAPAKSHDLTTLDTIKDELGVTDRKNDRKLLRWIHGASSAIETYTRRTFAAETVTETWFQRSSSLGLPLGVSIAPPMVQMPLRFDQHHALRLARYPVTNLISVTEDGSTLDPASTLLDAENGLLYRLSDSGDPVRWLARTIAVAYRGGYDLLGAVPFDLEQACIQLVKALWFTAGRDPTLRQLNVPGVQEETYWVGAQGEDGALPPDIAGKLEPYREIHVS